MTTGPVPGLGWFSVPAALPAARSTRAAARGVPRLGSGAPTSSSALAGSITGARPGRPLRRSIGPLPGPAALGRRRQADARPRRATTIARFERGRNGAAAILRRRWRPSLNVLGPPVRTCSPDSSAGGNDRTEFNASVATLHPSGGPATPCGSVPPASATVGRPRPGTSRGRRRRCLVCDPELLPPGRHRRRAIHRRWGSTRPQTPTSSAGGATAMGTPTSPARARRCSTPAVLPAG